MFVRVMKVGQVCKCWDGHSRLPFQRGNLLMQKWVILGLPLSLQAGQLVTSFRCAALSLSLPSLDLDRSLLSSWVQGDRFRSQARERRPWEAG